MSDPKWTAGPWYVGPYGRVSADASKCITGGVGVSGMVLTSGEEAEANAHLIAAAPELYKELYNVREWVKDGDYDDSFMAPIEAALAKARGEQ